MSDEENGKALEVRETGAYLMFDALDDAQVMAILEERIVENWVYHFPNKKGREIWGLAKEGIDQASLTLEENGFFFEEGLVHYEVDPGDTEYMLFSAEIKRSRYDRNLNKIAMGAITGYKRQWRYMELKTGEVVPDPFFYEKGAAKAFRNARSRAIRAEVKAQIIAKAKQLHKIRTVTDGEADQAAKPKSKVPDNAKNSRPGHEMHGNPVADGRVKALHKWMGDAGYPTTKDIAAFIGRHFKEDVPVCLHKWCMSGENWEKIKAVVADYVSTEGE